MQPPAESLVIVPPSLLPSRSDTPGAGVEGVVVGVDGGGTKTKAARLDLASGDYAVAHAGPSNVDLLGAEGSAKVLVELLDELLDGQPAPSAVVLGIAVVQLAVEDHDLICARIAERLGMPADKVFLMNDTVTAWACATQAQQGVIAIIGTGSNVFGVNETGGTWRSGGWGAVLGDEASGWWFGREVFRWALGFRDGTRSRPPFLEDLQAAVAPGEPVEALGRIATEAGKTMIASHAKHILELAESGHEEAGRIVSAGVAGLIPNIAACFERLGLTDAQRVLHPVGGVVSHFQVVRDELSRQLAELGGRCEFESKRLEPVDGGVLLAARAIGADEQRAVQLLTAHS